MSPLNYLALVAVAAGVTWAVTPFVRALGVRWRVVAKPGGRSVHEGEIARIGGVAMVAGFASAVGVQALGERFLDWDGGLLPGGWQVAGVLGGLAVIFLVGMLDDVFNMRAGGKLAGQAVAAGIVIAAGVRVDFVANPFGGGLVALGLLGIPVTLLWIVGFSNVINLIDGLDGLAAGVTAIAAVTFLVLADQSNQLEATAMACALVGACIGFLRYNFSPASIFMGDSGALFLGFALSSIALLGVMKSVAAVTLVVPLLIIGVPIFDTVSAIIRRTRHGRPLHEADRGHIHHRLLGRGFTQRQTVIVIYVWSAALAVGAYAMRFAPAPIRLLTFVVLAPLSGVMASWLGLLESAHQHGDEHRS